MIVRRELTHTRLVLHAFPSSKLKSTEREQVTGIRESLLTLQFIFSVFNIRLRIDYKYLLVRLRNFWLFGCNIRGEMYFKTYKISGCHRKAPQKKFLIHRPQRAWHSKSCCSSSDHQLLLCSYNINCVV